MTNGNKSSDSLKNGEIAIAAKWSTAAELISKLFLPISSLILARILTPEEFGIVATITMVLSLSDIISEAGFHKYIIQHQFENADSLHASANVAFWTNQGISLIIWIIIAILNDSIATLVGCPGLGNVLVIACVNIPLLGFSSIQSGLLKRDLNFKPLFYIRIFTSILPFVVTIPLALVYRNFWALIIGTIVKNVLTSFLLIVYTKWKPKLSFSFTRLKEMLSFSLWSMLETFSIWINQYIDVFLVGTLLSQYYLGLYKTSLTLVGQCVGVITSIFTPIIFSALSKLQNNESEFKRIFFKFQKIVALLVMPIGVVIFAESQLITEICLGDQWMEASRFIGLWGITSAFSIASVRYCTELYRAKGWPLLCFLVQIIVLSFLLPSIYYSARIGFKELCLARSAVEIVYFLINIILCYIYFHITPKDFCRNLFIPIIASIALYIFLIIMKSVIDFIFLRLVIIVIFSSLYYMLVFYFDKEVRNLFYSQIKSKFKFSH